MMPFSAKHVKQQFQSAQSHLARGDLSAARALFETVRKAAPSAPEPVFHLGRVARMEGDFPGAIALLERAHRLKPDEPSILALLAECQTINGDLAGAGDTHDKLIALRPSHPKPLADKALFLQQCGDFDGAEALFRRAVKRAPDSGELYRMWVGGRRIARGDPLLKTMQRLYTDPRMSATGRVHLGFALAKAMEDTGQTDKVFPYLHRANALQRAAHPYDAAAREAEIAALMARSDDTGPPSSHDFAPIIVTGLPRSGTTLVEQILAAHDGVVAGGELGIALRAAYSRFGTPPQITPLSDISAPQLDAFARDYARRARMQVHQDGRRITDKSIQTHLVLGHIARALPGATLIVVRRDPRDIALSIYKNYFAAGRHRYANDLADIAQYIKSFNAIVAFWKQRLDLHEIRYEDLIAAPEQRSRELVGAAGLDWQEQCLSFHKSKDAIKTLSLAQVRRPIYRSASGAWRTYERELAPFIEAWGDAPWD